MIEPRSPSPPQRRAVFFDRDGVLDRAKVIDGKPYPPQSLAEAELMPDALDACRAFAGAGALLICVTNQPDVARGTQSVENVEAINAWLMETLGLDACRVCWHDDVEGCLCRKPKPGLLLQAAEAYDVDLAASIMIGDRWRDIEAGQRAGCHTVFLDYHYAERQPDAPDFVFSSLAEAVAPVLSLLAA